MEGLKFLFFEAYTVQICTLQIIIKNGLCEIALMRDDVTIFFGNLKTRLGGDGFAGI